MVGYPPDSAYEMRMSESIRVGEYNVEVLRAAPMACPVCGDPSGNCKPEGVDSSPDHISGYGDGQTHLVEEDITEERQLAGGITITVLKYPKGKLIPIDEARNLGLI
jgi:hypothetical protein